MPDHAFAIYRFFPIKPVHLLSEIKTKNKINLKHIVIKTRMVKLITLSSKGYNKLRFIL